jgi:hypothetical protein
MRRELLHACSSFFSAARTRMMQFAGMPPAKTCSAAQGFCTDQSFSHPVLWRAPRVGTISSRNHASRDPVRESGDKIFGKCYARLLISSRTQMSFSSATISSQALTTSTMIWGFKCSVCYLIFYFRS